MAQALGSDCFEQAYSGLVPVQSRPWQLGRHLSRLRRRNNRPTYSEATNYSTQRLKGTFYCHLLRTGG